MKLKPKPLKFIIAFIVILLIAVSVILIPRIVNIPLVNNLSASKVFPEMLSTMNKVKTFGLQATLTINSDKVPDLSNQALTFTTSVNGSVDKTNFANPKSSGNIQFNVQVQGTSFNVKGDYALANNKIYYYINNASQNIPLNIGPLENKWIQSNNDNTAISSTLQLITNKASFYKTLTYIGISKVDNTLTYEYSGPLTKPELQALIKSQQNNFTESLLSKKLLDNINSILNGLQNAQISYYIGVNDNYLHKVNLHITSNSVNPSKDTSHTSYDLNANLDSFNHTQGVVVPTQSTTLQEAL